MPESPDEEVEALDLEWAPRLLRHLRLVLGRSLSSWAEDALQETFLRVRKGGYEPDRGGLSTWLFTIAHREALRIRRREALRAFLPLSSASVPVAPAPADPRLEEALDTLQPEVRAAILLVHLEDLTRKEAAEVLGVPERRVQDLCHRGFSELRKRLK